LSQEDGDKPVDNVDVAAAWQALESRAGSQLIDVRTRAEWTYVGVPDLESLGKRTVLVEWQTFPDQTIDPRFVERLAGELSALGVKLDDDLFFICRSGGRSLAAAKAMAAVPVTTSRAALKGRWMTRDIGAPRDQEISMII
jgi:rhodanese-related sulfurtransferase